MQTKPTSAYVHIPFCTQICYYCDFSKVFIKNQPVDDYLRALIREWELLDIKELRTLYIGGGTPTAISAEQLDYLLSHLQKNLDLSKLEEFTIEANPGDLTVDKIEVLKKSAVNRVSLGVQTFDDKHLRQIGRSHNQAQIYESIDSLKSAGFHNISIDLIYALPGQTMDQVKENVRKALELMESRHNLMYWNNDEYYGVGAGASGYVNGVRYRNRGPIQHYLKAIAEDGHARLQEEHLTKAEMMEEEFFLGLRKKSGVSIKRFEEKFGLSFADTYGDIVKKLQEDGLLVKDPEVVRMTKRGLFLGDSVAEQFILED